MNLPTKNILVFDIEASSTNIDKADLRLFGAYSFDDEKYYYFIENEIDAIQELIDRHKVVVGFNIKKYDIPVLTRHNIYFPYKTIIDLWEVLADPRIDIKTHTRSGGKGRGQYMGLKLNSWTLANIAKELELGEYKSEGFDYSLFEKPVKLWSDEQYLEAIDYLEQDIKTTVKLFEKTNDFYSGFIDYLSTKNVDKFTYITASIASLAYKIICHQANLDEIYNDSGERFEFEGGYVSTPKQKKCVGEILFFDFQSLYPSIMRGFNLFSPAVGNQPYFHENDLFKLKGYYRSDEQGVIETIIANLFKQRKEYKKIGDRREYLIKIIINSCYGILNNPAFAQVYSTTGGPDCTYIGREMIKYSMRTFENNGFKVLYGDTDSVAVYLNGKSAEEAINLSKEITRYLKTKMPFPHDDFNLNLDAELEAMFFFEEKGELKKKNYVYIKKVKDKKKLVIKGLPIIKSNASKVATTILKKYLEPQIIDKKEIEFFRGYLQGLIYHELKENISLATQTYKIKDAGEYRSETGLHYQILQKYGPGTHELVPNKKYGIGKDKKYCTVQEFREKCRVEDIDLSVCWNNLSPFIKVEQQTLDLFSSNSQNLNSRDTEISL